MKIKLLFRWQMKIKTSNNVPAGHPLSFKKIYLKSSTLESTLVCVLERNVAVGFSAVVSFQNVSSALELRLVLFQFSENNETLSILSLVPSVEDDGKYLTCRAENPKIKDSAIEDKWRLNVHCECFVKLSFLFRLWWMKFRSCWASFCLGVL